MTHGANPLAQLTPQRVRHMLNRLAGRRWAVQQQLDVSGGRVHAEPTDVQAAKSERYKPVRSGDFFGPAGGGWQQRWFKLRIPRAKEAEAGRRLLLWNCDGETTVWFKGQPWAGLDVGHAYCPLPDDGGDLYLDCGTYMTAIWAIPLKRMSPQGCQFQSATLVLRDELAWQVYYDLVALVELMERLLRANDIQVAGRQGYSPPIEKAPVVLRRLLHLLDGACDVYDKGASGDPVQQLERFGRRLKRIYKELKAGPCQGVAALCGHAHLDLVWLWPERETNRKGVHTFSTVLRLMERYPEFRFTQSQPAIYDAVRDISQPLFDEIKQRIKQGRWEATGGMEVESDVTIPSGEGLARALLYGQERFKELRGSYSRVLWIPDVFGYSNCLPQLMCLAGVDYFYTTKLTWSAVSKFPYSSFNWRSPDGSQVLTHLCPTGYNGVVGVDEICDPAMENIQSGVHDEVLLPTGYGDGAGGPNEDMLERARRFSDLTGIPQTKWTKVEDFFDRLAEVEADLPGFEGELYLEYHRGTYTTQGQLKLLYRNAEKALLAHESARVLTGKPALPIEAWLRVLFVQFHDAIPGSSIGLVYQQLLPELEAIIKRERESTERVLQGRGKRLSIFNPILMDRTVTVNIPAPQAKRVLTLADGTPVLMQRARQSWLARVPVPALSSVVLHETSGELLVKSSLVATSKRLANDLVDARFDSKGRLQSLSVRGQDTGLRGTAWRIYPDYPAEYDAWDIDRQALGLAEDVAIPLSLKVTGDGPVRASLSGKVALGAGSEMEVLYFLDADSDMLQVHVRIDWNEEHRLLKYHAITDRRGRMARYGAPFGAVSRTQVPGDAADEAQWEVPGQRWAAVTDDMGAGLAMVTAAKYGFSCRDGDLGLSLLRAPTHPDPDADRHVHNIGFALGAYSATTTEACLSTAAQAESLYGVRMPIPGGRSLVAPFSLDNLDGVVPAAIKPAEDGKGWVVRLHETAGSAAEVRLVPRASWRKVEVVDILERSSDHGSIRQEDDDWLVSVGPYQIVSLRIVPA